MAGSIGLNMVPSHPDLIEDRAAYFAEYAVQRNAAIAVKAGETVDGEEEEEVVEAFWVTEPAVQIAVSALGSKAKAAFLAAAAMGWEPRAWRSRTHHEPVRFASVSKEGAAKHHDAGDVRWPSHERRNYQIIAKSPTAPVGFRVCYMGKDDPKVQQAWDDRAFMSRRWIKAEPKDPAKQTTAGWSWGEGRDPLGVPIENFVDYTPSVARLSAVEAKNALTQGRVLDFNYNDGETRMEGSPLFRSVGQFTEWLDEWLDMLAPDHKKLTPVKKTTEIPEPLSLDGGLEALLNTEWSNE